MLKIPVFILLAIAIIIGCSSPKKKVKKEYREPAQVSNCSGPRTSDFDEAIPDIDDRLRTTYGIPATFNGNAAFSAVERAVKRERAAHESDDKKKDQKNFLKEAENIIDAAADSNDE